MKVFLTRAQKEKKNFIFLGGLLCYTLVKDNHFRSYLWLKPVIPVGCVMAH